MESSTIDNSTVKLQFVSPWGKFMLLRRSRISAEFTTFTMTAYYYLNPANESVGPLKPDEIRRLVEAGVLSSEVMVCEEGGEEWKSYSSVIDRSPAAPPQSAPAPLGPPKSAPLNEQGGYPSWFPMASMVVGIVSILFSCVPGFAFVLAAPAIAMGILAVVKSKVEATKRTQAVTGVATGGVSILIVLASLAFGIIGSPFNQEASAIERVLREEGAVIRQAKSKYPRNSIDQTRFVAGQMQSIDTSRCPPDFRYAFQQHVNAWEQAVPYVFANTGLTAFFEGLYAGYTEDYGVIGTANYQAQMALRYVDSTFHEVKSISAKYGAKIPQF